MKLKFFKTCLPAGRKTKPEPENLKEVLEYLKRLEKSHEEITRELAGLKGENKKNLQKIGIIRFNPFKETGGDQSFSIAMLDANNDGFVITSLYGREGNRVYAKPIHQGHSKYQLSEEEKEAINKAINV